MSTGTRKQDKLTTSRAAEARPQATAETAARLPAVDGRTQPRPRRSQSRYHQRRRGPGSGTKALLIVGLAIAALGLIFVLNNRDVASSAGGQGGKYPYLVGKPGPGEQAPPIKLPSTDGGTFDLAALRGQTVLLYFQEGVMCQPCWDQLKDIEAKRGEFQALGIDRIVTITTDPLDALQQKVANERIASPVLSDPGVVVSKAYQTNQYGMMGTSYNGHSFVLVGPDGTITWRADYGGAPKYTMYLPVPDLIADIRNGLANGGR